MLDFAAVPEMPIETDVSSIFVRINKFVVKKFDAVNYSVP